MTCNIQGGKQRPLLDKINNYMSSSNFSRNSENEQKGNTYLQERAEHTHNFLLVCLCTSASYTHAKQNNLPKESIRWGDRM